MKINYNIKEYLKRGTLVYPISKSTGLYPLDRSAYAKGETPYYIIDDLNYMWEGESTIKCGILGSNNKFELFLREDLKLYTDEDKI